MLNEISQILKDKMKGFLLHEAAKLKEEEGLLEVAKGRGRSFDHWKQNVVRCLICASVLQQGGKTS